MKPIRHEPLDILGFVEETRDMVAKAFLNADAAERQKVFDTIGIVIKDMSAAEADDALGERTQSLARMALSIGISQGLHEAAGHFEAQHLAEQARELRRLADQFAHYVTVDVAAIARVTARAQQTTDGALPSHFTEACLYPRGAHSGAIH